MSTANAIVDVFIETMESMAFVDVLPTDKVPNFKNPIVVRMGIMMPYMGDVVIVFSENLANLLIDNLLGEGAEDSDQALLDATGEFLNVYVGKLLDVLHTDILFELGLPKRIEFNDIKSEDFNIVHFSDPNNFSVSLYHKLKL